MLPGRYRRRFEELMCDLIVAFTMRHYPRYACALIASTLDLLFSCRHRLPFPARLEWLLRYDKWVSRESFRETLEIIIFVGYFFVYIINQ